VRHGRLHAVAEQQLAGGGVRVDGQLARDIPHVLRRRGRGAAARAAVDPVADQRTVSDHDDHHDDHYDDQRGYHHHDDHHDDHRDEMTITMTMIMKMITAMMIMTRIVTVIMMVSTMVSTMLC
jgi:hypothetical protein